VIGHLPSAFNLALAHLRDATSLWRFLTIRFESLVYGILSQQRDLSLCDENPLADRLGLPCNE
jgi:hypothetical protein